MLEFLVAHPLMVYVLYACSLILVTRYVACPLIDYLVGIPKRHAESREARRRWQVYVETELNKEKLLNGK